MFIVAFLASRLFGKGSMANVTIKLALSLSFLGVVSLWGQPRLAAPDVSVGRNLQVLTSVALSEPASGDLDMTIKSSDPSKLLIAKNPIEKGTESIVVRVRDRFRQSPEFCLQALTGDGSATYSTSVNGYADAKGTVTFADSAIVLTGPFKAASYPTVVGAWPLKLNLTAVRVDSSHKLVEEQLVAVQPSLAVNLVASKPTVGTLSESEVVIKSGTSFESVEFTPGAKGETIFSLKQPPGFVTPSEFATWKAVVSDPAMGVTDEVAVGKDLQIGGVLKLGARAPDQGLTIILKSNNPDKLLFSLKASEIGSPTLTLTVKPGQANGQYFLQSLADSGTATYTATADGYRQALGTVTCAPSGIVITPVEQGPPDEAQVLRKNPSNDSGIYKFVSNLAGGNLSRLVVWMVQLDPITHRGADITVQALRAGLSLTVPITIKDPAIGKIPESVSVLGGTNSIVFDFEPLHAGTTTVSVATPQGFTAAANSTSVVGLVR